MSYSDLNMTTPTIQQLLVGVPVVYQSLQALFSTKPGERLFRPEFGLNFENFLFSPLDDSTSLIIREVIKSTLQQFEPRVTVEFADSEIIPIPEEQKIYLSLTCSINGEYFTMQGYITP